MIVSKDNSRFWEQGRLANSLPDLQGGTGLLLHKKRLILPAIMTLIILCSSAPATHLEASVPLPSRVAVTPAGCDDMAKVIESLGFFPSAIEEGELKSVAQLRQYEAVFINCSPTIDDFVDAAPAIREYVQNGGIIYASDKAGSLINAAFPGKMNLYQDDLAARKFGKYRGSRIGFAGSYQAKATDPSLATALGKDTIEATFSDPGWTVIDSVASDVQVIVEGPVKIEDYSTDPEHNSIALPGNKPYAVTFTEGKGEVLYTNFHYEDQMSPDMKGVLDWFAVRTMTGNLLKSARQTAANGGDKVLLEVVDGVHKGESKAYGVKASGKGDLNFIFNSRIGGFSFEVDDTKDKAVIPKIGAYPGMIKELENAKGQYTVYIGGRTVMVEVLPFVLIVTEKPEVTPKKPEQRRPDPISRRLLKPITRYSRTICAAGTCIILLLVLLVAIFIVVIKRRKPVKE